jgi:hypothetical protein
MTQMAMVEIITTAAARLSFMGLRRTAENVRSRADGPRRFNAR